MKILIALILLLLVTACSHPLKIAGEGDIISSTGNNDCLWEDRPCDNYVTGDYDVIYTALPREGWEFSGWQGCGDQGPDCSFSVPGSTVDLLWGQTAPALTAVFTQNTNSPSITASTIWSAAAATLTIDVSVSNIAPNAVLLYPKGIDDGWVEEDTSVPFSFTVDTSEFEPGDHEVLIVANDGNTSVSKTEIITVRGCNGKAHLCDRPYNQAHYVTTHNAMSSSADGWIGPNQNLDVPAQLDFGVRALMLDAWEAGDLNQFDLIQVPDEDPEMTLLCHALCALGKQPLVDGLGEITDFLDANPGEVVTIIFESYISSGQTAAAFDAADLTKYTYQHDGGAWPTLGQMIDADTRLVVFQDVAVYPSYPWQMYVWDHAFETHYAAATPEDFSCNVNRGNPSHDLFIFNNFLTNIFGSPESAEQVNSNPFLKARIIECEAFHATMANFVTVDFVSIGDTVISVDELNASGSY
ncbi:MAG: hypothetical protein OSA77_07210 [Halioglobus sp.]|nr:hypothetical protein [Halioglobus sp.]